MTLPTVTAPINMDQRKAIKEELIELLADDRSIELPQHGCTGIDMSRVASGLSGRSWELYRSIPSEYRDGDLAIVIARAAAKRAGK